MENVIEHLPKDCVLPLLRERIAELSAVEGMLSKRLSRAPAGVLNVSPHRGGFQYFRVTAKTGRKGEYIPERKMSLASAIAQRDYDAKMLAEIQRQRGALEKCVEKYDVSVAENLYAQLHPARRSLVAPLVYPDDDFVARWSAVNYSGRGFDADGPMLMTARGERVRSKSEIIIADALFRRGIPYRYEYPHELLLAGARNRKRIVVYPDFTCLNVRTHREIVWEHFGMTTETHDRPLNSMMVEAMLERLAG